MTVGFAFNVRLTTIHCLFKAIHLFHVCLLQRAVKTFSQALTTCLKKLAQDELKVFKKLLWDRYPERFHDPLDGLDLVDLVDKMLELCDIEVSMKITLALLHFMNLKKLSEYLLGLCKRSKFYY